MDQDRGKLYLLTGLALGLILGLVISIGIAPKKFNYSAPQSLSDEYKAMYRSMIALSYNANHDLGRARARMALLQDVNPGAVFSAQAQKLLASGGDVMEANALSILGQILTKKENVPAAADSTPQPGPSGTP
ncbi:MAG: hypothetical protein AAGU05_07430 [Anaerolineaceae bacterium]